MRRQPLSSSPRSTRRQGNRRSCMQSVHILKERDVTMDNSPSAAHIAATLTTTELHLLFLLRGLFTLAYTMDFLVNADELRQHTDVDSWLPA
jgi:hypothetical protein